jgi:D-3-phosphoglycerate dehydrogenase / 2-oxoglutarate reductase
MSSVNSKRVFFVKPHVPAGYLDILGKREDVRLDRLEHDSAPDLAAPVLAAAHAYQTSSTRDELARHFHTGTELLQRTPNLLLVSTNGAGYDTVDVKACTERGILVVNQAGGNAESVAEHVLGMMLMLVKRAIDCDRALRAGTLVNRADFTGREAFGKTIGIVGIGNVGRRVAELCGGLLRMQAIAYDPYVDAEEMRRRGARKVELDELLRSADFVSINCPLTDETRKMIGAREYALMQPTAYFITTARGFIHDEAALAAAREENRRGGARCLGQGTAGRRPSIAEIRQCHRHRTHRRRHTRSPRQYGQDRRRTGVGRARRQAGDPHRQSAGVAGLRQALRAHVRFYAGALNTLPQGERESFGADTQN